MLLKDHDLLQIDEPYLNALGRPQLLSVSVKLLKDLKESRERLNQNPSNSSRPPSSQPPWVGPDVDEDDEAGKEARDPQENDASNPDGKGDQENQDQEAKEADGSRNPSPPGRKAGKQEGSPGHGRTQKLPITGEVSHRAEQCAACGRGFDEDATFVPRTGFFVLDIKLGNEESPGLDVSNEKQLYGDTICPCGHVTRTMPERCPPDSQWNVELTPWRLVGPMLVSLICCLSMRMRLSRPRIRELLSEWLSLRLSTGTIHQCIHEAGRAVSPLEEQLIEEVRKSKLLHIDETGWKEKAKALWLWVVVTSQVALYVIGSRKSETIEKILGTDFSGWIMTDGYQVYRQYTNRLRCWTHLLRKARGLKESLDEKPRAFGVKTYDVLTTLMEAIYQARDAPGEDLCETYAPLLHDFCQVCTDHWDASHEKTRQLAREFLHDWDAIFRVLEHPELPLTNNEAELMLRFWVISRKICYGTRTPQGSRTFALLASVIDTCRKREINAWVYLASVISERRHGRIAPPIPSAI
jgi:transposase